jgi:hypothetical protein
MALRPQKRPKPNAGINLAFAPVLPFYTKIGLECFGPQNAQVFQFLAKPYGPTPAANPLKTHAYK